MLASRLVLIGQHYTQPQKATNKDLLATTIQITLNPHPPTHNTKTGGGVEQHKRVTTFAVVIVVGKRPETFRTRKLSPQTPMVLHPTECGRVGHRRNITQTNPLLDHHSKRGFTTVHKHKTQSAKPKTVCTLTLNSTYSPTGTCQGAHCCTCPSKKAVLMRLFCNRAFPSVRCVGPCISRIAVIVSSESSLYTAQPSRLP